MRPTAPDAYTDGKMLTILQAEERERERRMWPQFNSQRGALEVSTWKLQSGELPKAFAIKGVYVSVTNNLLLRSDR